MLVCRSIGVGEGGGGGREVPAQSRYSQILDEFLMTWIFKEDYDRLDFEVFFLVLDFGAVFALWILVGFQHLDFNPV